MNKSIIIAENLTKSFDQTTILHACNLQLTKNKITVITGPSGSGKSTLLYLLSGLLSPTSGQVLIKQSNDQLVTLSQFSNKKRAHFIGKNIGFVFQNFQLLPDFTVFENILIPAFFVQKNDKEQLKQKVLTLLDRFDLLKRKDAFPSEISGGESQRVAIIRAIINQPRILFCDEPTGNLDSFQTDKLITLLKQFQLELGLTVVIVTHDEKLKMIGNYHFLIKDGNLMIPSLSYTINRF